MSSGIEEKKMSSLIPAMLEGIKIPVVQATIKTNKHDPKMDMDINDIVEKEINDIIGNKDLKAKILELVAQEWPFSCIKGQESWQTFLDIIRRDISTKLSEELSKIDIIEDESDVSDLSKQKLKNYMLDIVETLYNDDHLTGSQYSSEIEPKNKFEYEVIMKRVKQDPNYNGNVDATTTVALVGSDNVIQKSVMLSDDITQFSLPIKSLTSERLEIQLDQRNSNEKSPERKLRQKFHKLMTRKNTKENMEDNTTFEEIKISEISFHEEVTKNLPDGSKWEIKLGIKFDNNGNENFITVEDLEAFHVLTMAKETTVDVQALLNYLRPFFSPENWKMSELTSRVKLLHKKKYSRDLEENILQELMELDDLSKLDSICLMSFKEFCLEAICAFEVKTHDTESEVISPSNNDDVTIKRLHEIIKTLNHIFPAKNQYEKEFHLLMFRKLEQNMQIASDFNNLDKLCQKVEEQILTTDYIVQNFHDFALNIWCPILSENYLKIMLPKVDEMIAREIDSSKDVESFSNLFRKLNNLSIYCNDVQRRSEQLAKTFESLFIKWAQDEKDVAEEHMTNLYFEEVKEKDAFEAKESKEENWKAFDQTIHIKRIFQKRHDDWNKQCDGHCVNVEQKEKYGKNLYHHLVGVLCSYATKLMELIMRDNNFDKVEFVMFLNTMHGSVHFLNQLFKIEDKNLFTDDEKLIGILSRATRQFVAGQQLIFQQKIQDGEKICDNENDDLLCKYLFIIIF